MPQFIEFPPIPKTDPHHAVTGLIAACRGLSGGAQPLKDFRATLKEHKVWDRERANAVFRFLRLSGGKMLQPSDVSESIASAEDDAAARLAVAKRLWDVNPLMFKAVIDCLNERVYSREEIYSFIDSVGYRGTKLRKAEVDTWLNFGHGLGLIRQIGIAFGLDERGEEFVRPALDFDIDEFLDDDEDEPDLAMVGDDEGDEASAEAGASASATAATPAVPVIDMDSPIGRNRPVELARFAGHGVFADEVLADTTGWIEAWWTSQSSRPDKPQLEDFGFDSEQWMEGADELIYRIAVAASLVFRLGADRAGVRGAFQALDRAGVLRDLYYGTAPDILSDAVDSKALMLASLVARRCAECPDLANDLEKQDTAAQAFAALDTALGRGLFRIELFWIMRALQSLGVLRFEDIANYTALPERLVRDTLFRLGYIASPYAHDQQSLVEAAAAARKAAGSAAPADDVLSSFSLAAGCAYDCPHAKTCDYACRERAG